MRKPKRRIKDYTHLSTPYRDKLRDSHLTMDSLMVLYTKNLYFLKRDYMYKIECSHIPTFSMHTIKTLLRIVEVVERQITIRNDHQQRIICAERNSQRIAAN